MQDESPQIYIDGLYRWKSNIYRWTAYIKQGTSNFLQDKYASA
jgi:hypothetical protein